MNDILLDQKEIQAQMAETNHLMNEMAQSTNQDDEEDLFKELEMEVAREKANQATLQLGPKQSVPVSVVQPSINPSYVQPQSKQVYAPMTAGQQYSSGSTGLQSQYQQQYSQPGNQTRSKANNHIDEITRMLNS